MNDYEVTVTDDSYEVDIGNNAVTALFTKALTLNFQSGNQASSWTFATTLPGSIADYVVTLGMLNTADSFPISLIPHVSAFNTSTITITVDSPPDTNNYYVGVTLTPRWNP